MIWRTKLQTLLETNSLFWSPLSDSRSYICETQTFLYPPIFLKQWKFRGLSRSGIYFVRKNQRTFKTTKKRYSYDYMGDWYPVSFPTLLWKREPDKLILPSSPSRHMTKSRSISTVEGSGATCTRIFFELFFQNRWSFYGPVDPKHAKNFKKVKKTPKMHWHHTTQMVMETLVTSG